MTLVDVSKAISSESRLNLPLVSDDNPGLVLIALMSTSALLVQSKTVMVVLSVSAIYVPTTIAVRDSCQLSCRKKQHMSF